MRVKLPTTSFCCDYRRVNKGEWEEGGGGGGLRADATVTQESCRNNLFCKQDRATSGLSNEPFAFVYGGSYIRPIISRDLFICSSSDVSIHTTECRQEIFFRDKVLVQSKIIVFYFKNSI